ncbi:MAG: HAD family hydrolase [Bacteroidales bacterium]|nr:HAD family hydrolase [Bacteroidales bacterium]
MQKAIFIDRDGVISNNRDHYYLTQVEDFQFNPGVFETLAELQNRGYIFIVITNQGGISQGMNSVKNVDNIHDHMDALLNLKGIKIREIYYCPHHSDNEACLCRKPLPLMIEKTLARYNIDPQQSWFIGDSERDVEAGKAAGVQTILINPNSNLTQVLDRIH